MKKRKLQGRGRKTKQPSGDIKVKQELGAGEIKDDGVEVKVEVKVEAKVDTAGLVQADLASGPFPQFARPYEEVRKPMFGNTNTFSFCWKGAVHLPMQNH